jgi:hypothetical protein
MPAADPPASKPTVFARPKLGIQLAYPPGWEARANKDYELFLKPARSGDGGDTLMSLDVPELPFHVPGMIPIGSVRSGYLDDLKKQVGPVTTEDLQPPNVGASARMVQSRWKTPSGEGVEETALLMVHGDRVYLLRARAASGHAEETRAAFDEVVRSVRWVKP